MYIIGMIFKIIGILLLVIIGIVLVLLLSVLFVPIRYRFSWEKQEETSHFVRIGLSWLFHILALSVEYQEQICYVIRIFGIPVKKGILQQDEEAQDMERYEDGTDDIPSETSFEKKKENTEENTVQREIPIDPFFTKKNKTTEKENTKKETMEIDVDLQEFGIALQSTPKKKISFWKRFLEKAKKFVAFIKKIPNFFKSLFYKVRDLWQNVDGKRTHMMEQIHTVIDFWQAKENQKGKQLIFTKGKKMLAHILPKKWKGQVWFGFSNPAATGQALAVISIVGGLVGIIPNIEPDFSKETLEGKVSCRGRLQIGYLLWLGLSLWFHEDMKRVKDNFEKVRRVL